MIEQLQLDGTTITHALCGHVCLRLRDRDYTAELTCTEPPGHRGGHNYVRLKRLRSTQDVPVRDGIL